MEDKVLNFWKSKLYEELQSERNRADTENIEARQYHTGRSELLEELLGWKVERPNPFK
jgi:hypothetical protein